MEADDIFYGSSLREAALPRSPEAEKKVSDTDLLRLASRKQEAVEVGRTASLEKREGGTSFALIFMVERGKLVVRQLFSDGRNQLAHIGESVAEAAETANRKMQLSRQAGWKPVVPRDPGLMVYTSKGALYGLVWEKLPERYKRAGTSI